MILLYAYLAGIEPSMMLAKIDAIFWALIAGAVVVLVLLYFTHQHFKVKEEDEEEDEEEEEDW